MLGPTASGISDVALRLAETLGAEIISVDSMQVYRRMDIGTAKPSLAERARVVHHGLDLVDPTDEYSVSDFQKMGRRIIESSEVPLIIAGGSGLHFRALVDPMRFRPRDPEVRARLERLTLPEAVARLRAGDPEAEAHVDLANPRRVIRALEILELTGETPTARTASEERRRLDSYEPLVAFRAVALDPGDALAERVDRRLDVMLDAGLLDEVAAVAPKLGRTARQAVGYKELLPVVAGRASLQEGVDAARRATLALAKRQRTYFRRDPRLNWLPWSDDPDVRVRAAVEAVRS